MSNDKRSQLKKFISDENFDINGVYVLPKDGVHRITDSFLWVGTINPGEYINLQLNNSVNVSSSDNVTFTRKQLNDLIDLLGELRSAIEKSSK